VVLCVLSLILLFPFLLIDNWTQKKNYSLKYVYFHLSDLLSHALKINAKNMVRDLTDMKGLRFYSFQRKGN
jgi:hypothetical protein